MAREEIMRELYRILSDKFLIPRDLLVESNHAIPFISDAYKMDALLLSYFHFEVCKCFGVSFRDEDLLEYGFFTLESVIALLEAVTAV